MKYYSEKGLEIIELKGNIQQDETEKIEDVLADFFEKKITKIIIDLRAVTLIPSATLGVLVNYKRKFKKENGDIYLVSNSEEVFQLLQITMLDKIFKVYDSVDEAVKLILEE